MTSPLPADEDREALQRLIYTFETTDLGDNLAITTRDSYALVDAILSAGFRRSAVSAPPTITDEMADRAQIAMHEFCFGDGEPPTRRQLGIARQGWKVAIAAALGGEA